MAAAMLAVSFDYLAHFAMILGIAALLCAPGVILFLRWPIGQLPGVAGFGAGLIATRILIYLVLNDSGIIRVASWLIRHWPISVGTLIVVVGGCIGLWFVAKHHHWNEVGNTLARIVAVLFGGAGGIAIMTVLIVGLFWARRYQQPVGVDIDVPAITLDVGVYVALGDSYSAGEGLRPYQTGSNTNEDNCHRSSRAYSQQLHFATPLTRPIVFRACSGAVAGDVYDFAQNSQFGIQVRPQLLDATTGLVTLSMGGNDAHFAGVLKFCGQTRNCMNKRFNPGRAGPDEAGLAQPQLLEQWGHAMVDVVRARDERLFTRLRHDAPNARIVVVGYPKLLPTGDVPRQFDGCDILLDAFDSGEREKISALEDRLNDVIYAAARRAQVEFIDPTVAFSSHEACGVRGELINGVKVSLVDGRFFVAVDRGAFHPRREGQLVLARELSCYLNANPKAPITYAKTAPGTTDNPIACD